MKSKFVLGCVLFLLVRTTLVGAWTVANSVSSFSSTQGWNHWYYGYYDGDGPAPYSSADFEQFSNYSAGSWYLNQTSYWTSIQADRAHPNGNITSGGKLSAEQWAVRRWVSTVNSSVTISGTLADVMDEAGDGTVGYIFVDGAEVFNHLINNGDMTGLNFNVNATLMVGSTVDFALAPRSSDLSDSTIFTSVITTIPEPATFLLLGLGGLSLLRKHRA